MADQLLEESVLLALWVSDAAVARWNALGVDPVLLDNAEYAEAAQLIVSRGVVYEDHLPRIGHLLFGERARAWAGDPEFCVRTVDRFAKETAATWAPHFFALVTERLRRGADVGLVLIEVDWLLGLFRPPMLPEVAA